MAIEQGMSAREWEVVFGALAILGVLTGIVWYLLKGKFDQFGKNEERILAVVQTQALTDQKLSTTASQANLDLLKQRLERVESDVLSLRADISKIDTIVSDELGGIESAMVGIRDSVRDLSRK